jgi:hypothetical protein
MLDSGGREYVERAFEVIGLEAARLVIRLCDNPAVVRRVQRLAVRFVH